METITMIHPKNVCFFKKATLPFCLSEFMRTANCETRTLPIKDSHEAKVRALTPKEIRRKNVSVIRVAKHDKQPSSVSAPLIKDKATIKKRPRWSDYYHMLRRIGQRLS